VGHRRGIALSPQSPAGFVDVVTTPVRPESHPPNASISSLLVDWQVLEARVQSGRFVVRSVCAASAFLLTVILDEYTSP